MTFYINKDIHIYVFHNGQVVNILCRRHGRHFCVGIGVSLKGGGCRIDMLAVPVLACNSGVYHFLSLTFGAGEHSRGGGVILCPGPFRLVIDVRRFLRRQQRFARNVLGCHRVRCHVVHSVLVHKGLYKGKAALIRFRIDAVGGLVPA